MQFVFHNQALSKYTVDNFMNLILCANELTSIKLVGQKKNPLTV